MIKHIVMWKLKSKTLPLEQCIDALLIKKTLEGLKDKIEEIQKIEVGFDFSGDETAWDIILYSEFASKEDLNNYQKHPAHVSAGQTVIKPNTFDRRMIDYEI
ncbi:MAG: Dabb family protein [Desulfotalea sp.]